MDVVGGDLQFSRPERYSSCSPPSAPALRSLPSKAHGPSIITSTQRPFLLLSRGASAFHKCWVPTPRGPNPKQRGFGFTVMCSDIVRGMGSGPYAPALDEGHLLLVFKNRQDLGVPPGSQGEQNLGVGGEEESERVIGCRLPRREAHRGHHHADSACTLDIYHPRAAGSGK